MLTIRGQTKNVKTYIPSIGSQAVSNPFGRVQARHLYLPYVSKRDTLQFEKNEDLNLVKSLLQKADIAKIKLRLTRP